MKLRGIHLNNIRRFTDPVRIENIADGVNVLCAPNEFGKSTIFDALHALFFLPHGSKAREITLLRPHAGGSPEVGVEIETHDGIFHISKRWFGKPEARVSHLGRLIAQADEAEAWISRLLGGGDGGPSGLLWVRQGITGFGEGSKSEQQAALDARRDLLSSVTGEVEAMTGGRRMDAALARCVAELEAMANAKGKPRLIGPWAEARRHVEELAAEREQLEESVSLLQDALATRVRLRRELAELEAPDAAAERLARVKAAKAAHEAAEAHAATVTAAEQTLLTATLTADRAREKLETLRRVVTDHAEATRLDIETKTRLAQVEETMGNAEARYSEAVAAHDSAKGAQQQAEDMLRRVQAHSAAMAAGERRAELEERVSKALAARQVVESAAADASVGPDDKVIERLRVLASDVSTANALRDSTATRVTMRYEAGRVGGVRREDGALDEGAVIAIHRDTVLLLEGLGELIVHPGEGPEGMADVEKAEAALAKAFVALGVRSIAEAAEAHRRRKAASDQLTRARTELAAFAPKGIEDLQLQLAGLPAPLEEDGTELPSVEEATAAAQACKTHVEELATEREARREARDTARTERAQAHVRLEAVAERLATAAAALDRLAVADEAELVAKLAAADVQRTAAEQVVARVMAAAPDVQSTLASLNRAQSIEDVARKRIGEHRLEIAKLSERIDNTAGDAVEERLQETLEKLGTAETRLARIEREVKTLLRLRRALDEARSEARDRYFAPVAGELKPLLNLLWPDAELHWADDTLLPHALTRNGQEELVGSLSGGTQEQIALLVRLAFARLLAKDGRHAPVILDDALVFTDDDRIERMFDALHRQAGDLQIIVLSCRQRAFQDLGGEPLRITTAAEG